MDTYEHDALRDLTGQLRLLQIFPADPSDHITISIQTFDRTTAPPYSALSYTWGDNRLSRRLVANDKVMDITENCWYALGQLRLSSFSDYYWIDQLCINQADPVEKSAQVNSMGDTYRKADSVLVSLGRHTKETSYLFKQIITNGVVTLDSVVGTEVHIEDWLKFLIAADLERLISAVVAFGTLPYWSRVWTVQEFALPPHAMLLCGNGCLEWQTLASLHAMLHRLLRVNREYYRRQVTIHHTERGFMALPMNETMVLRSTIQKTSAKLANFSDVVLKLGMRDCIDIRDRIFGLLSLVDWHEEQHRLQADYTLSASELALMALECAGGRRESLVACQLIRMLEIPQTDSQMALLSGDRPLEPDEHEEIIYIPLELPVTISKCRYYYQLTTEDIRARHLDSWVTLGVERMLKASKTEVLAEANAFIPSLARPGDIILQLDSFTNSRTGVLPEHDQAATSEVDILFDKAGLVLREDNDNRFQIVGHAIFSSGSYRLSQLASIREGELEFDLHLGHQDLLYWTWQLHQSQKIDISTSGSVNRVQPLTTRFCQLPFSSYATAKKNSEKAVLHDVTRKLAHALQDAKDIRQKLALRRIGE